MQLAMIRRTLGLSGRRAVGRYALLLLHLLLLPVLQVVTEGHPRAEIISIAAEQVILVAAAGVIGGWRMLLVGVPLCVPGVATALAVVAGGEIPPAWAHVWAIARSLSFIVPIMTISLLILVDVLAAERVVFDMICGALCVYVLLGMCWANVYVLLERVVPGSFLVDFSRYQVDPAVDPFAPMGVFLYYSFVTFTTVGYGDIVPSSAVARWLVWVQAVFGQFYMAVFVARLIGMQAPASGADRATATDAPGHGPESLSIQPDSRIRRVAA